MFNLARMLLTITLLGFAASAALAEPTPRGAETPALPRRADSVAAFAPPGWTIEAQAHGILGDGARPATVMVLKATDPSISAVRRQLIVLCGGAHGGYALATRNSTLLPDQPANDGLGYTLGDATQPGLQFDRGSLRVNIAQAMDAGPIAERDRSYVFRFRDGRLYLVGLDDFIVGFDLDTANWSYNYLTGKAALSRGAHCAGRRDVIAHCRYTRTWKTLSPGHPIPIDAIGDGLAFEPETHQP